MTIRNTAVHKLNYSSPKDLCWAVMHNLNTPARIHYKSNIALYTMIQKGFLGRALLADNNVTQLSLASLGFSYFNTYDGKSLNALKDYTTSIFCEAFPDERIRRAD